jgi:hypothetical protein
MDQKKKQVAGSCEHGNEPGVLKRLGKILEYYFLNNKYIPCWWLSFSYKNIYPNYITASDKGRSTAFF